jgi:hypothetical protein
MSLEAHDVPFNAIESRIMQWVEEALELRYGSAGDPDGAIALPGYEITDHATYANLLARTRIRLDRVSELRDKATQARGRAVRAPKNAEFEAQQAFDQAMQRRGATRTVGFVTAAEKNADASLDSFEQKRLAHQAERLVSVTTEAKTLIDNAYWGLSSIREELLSFYKGVQFVTHGIEVTSEHFPSQTS